MINPSESVSQLDQQELAVAMDYYTKMEEMGKSWFADYNSQGHKELIRKTHSYGVLVIYFGLVLFLAVGASISTFYPDLGLNLASEAIGALVTFTAVERFWSSRVQEREHSLKVNYTMQRIGEAYKELLDLIPEMREAANNGYDEWKSKKAKWDAAEQLLNNALKSRRH